MYEDLIARIDALIKRKGETPTAAFRGAGVGKDFFYHLRSGVKPSFDKIKKLAEYFNVSADYLMGIENSSTPFGVPDIEALKTAERIVNLPDDQKRLLLGLLDSLENPRRK
ncbi:MAG: helix-turn-helix domain-containing protein [Oscillospiraceae bacterium]|nr:helix-turn-helix domain-containing protein [Oscillospiraceae bacterium]